MGFMKLNLNATSVDSSESPPGPGQTCHHFFISEVFRKDVEFGEDIHDSVSCK